MYGYRKPEVWMPLSVALMYPFKVLCPLIKMMSSHSYFGMQKHLERSGKRNMGIVINKKPKLKLML